MSWLHLSQHFTFQALSVHSLLKEKKGKKKREREKDTKTENSLRKSLNKSFLFPSPPFLLSFFSFCTKIKGSKLPGADKGGPPSFSCSLQPPILWNLAGICYGFRGNQTLTGQPEGQTGGAGKKGRSVRGGSQHLAAVTPMDAHEKLPLGL